MIIPDDLIVDIRGQRIRLTLGTRWVEIDNGGRVGVFSRGPLTVRELKQRWLEPAMDQLLQEPQPK